MPSRSTARTACLAMPSLRAGEPVAAEGSSPYRRPVPLLTERAPRWSPMPPVQSCQNATEVTSGF